VVLCGLGEENHKIKSMSISREKEIVLGDEIVLCEQCNNNDDDDDVDDDDDDDDGDDGSYDGDHDGGGVFKWISS